METLDKIKNEINLKLIFTMNQNEVISGLTTGIITAIIFNPIDKAIYVSTTKNLSIFNKEVWSKCFKGTINTTMTRLITSGLYFTFLDRNYGIRGFGIGFASIFLRDVCFNYLYLSLKKKDDHLHNLSIITLSLIGVSPLNLIKNKKYGTNESLREILKNFKFHQLGISKSVLRTSASFYFSQFIYDFTKENFSKKY
jgi:hypothetical protein